MAKKSTALDRAWHAGPLPEPPYRGGLIARCGEAGPWELLHVVTVRTHLAMKLSAYHIPGCVSFWADPDGTAVLDPTRSDWEWCWLWRMNPSD